MTRIVSGLILIASLVGCAAHVSGLQHDKSFNYNAVKAGGIAVGGVTSIIDQVSEQELNYFGELYRRQIVEERGEFRVVPVGKIANGLGDDYQPLMEGFRAHGVVDEKSVSQLRQLNLPAQYVIFSRIEDHYVEENNSESPVFDKDGKEVKNKTNVTLSTVANVTAFTRIYDRQTGKSVWSGSVTQSKTNENSFESYSGSSFKKALADAIIGDIAESREQPPEPEFNDVLSQVFRGFAENLPKKD